MRLQNSDLTGLYKGHVFILELNDLYFRCINHVERQSTVALSQTGLQSARVSNALCSLTLKPCCLSLLTTLLMISLILLSHWLANPLGIIMPASSSTVRLFISVLMSRSKTHFWTHGGKRPNKIINGFVSNLLSCECFNALSLVQSLHP